MSSSFKYIFGGVVVLWLSVVLTLAPPIVRSDQAQYFYDELGRLIGVVDGSGDAAVYTYDEVGNLLSIERFTAEATGIGVFLVAPASGAVGAEVQVQGFGFSTTPGDNQVAFNGTAATVVSSTTTSLVATVPTEKGGRNLRNPFLDTLGLPSLYDKAVKPFRGHDKGSWHLCAPSRCSARPAARRVSLAANIRLTSSRSVRLKR